MIEEKSVKEWYEKLSNDFYSGSNKWNYWGCSYGQRDIFQSEDSAKQFLNEIIRKSGKSEEDLGMMINCVGRRYLHIVSAFFLGIYVMENNTKILGSILDLLRKIEEIKEDWVAYVWSLICLFHDVGYIVEQKGCEIEKLICKKEYQSDLPKDKKGIPSIYSKKLLKSYQTYRYCRFDVKDHGIYGGRIVYNKMCKIRRKKVNSNINSNINKKPLLYWGEELEKIYGMAGWTIACHNIFTVPSSSDTKCYKCNGLDKLIYEDKYRKIKSDLHPLLFILCLVDSIEPIKTIGIEGLDQVKMSIANNELIMDIQGIADTDVRQKYGEKIYDLNNWLTDVRVEDNYVYKINMNNN